MNQLLNACLPFARQMIEKHGEFFPFGASLEPDGAVNMVAAGTHEQVPASQQLIEELTGAFRTRAQRSEIRAAAICANIEMKTPERRSDAIQVTIEHVGADPVRVFMSYRNAPSSGYEFDEVSAAEATRTIFVG
jgi:hypothetical protein